MRKLIIFLLLFETIYLHPKGAFIGCGGSDAKQIPTAELNILKIDENDPSYKRRMDGTETEYHDIHIYFDYVSLNDQITKYKWSTQNASMLTNAIKKAIKTLESLLKTTKPSNLIWKDEALTKMGVESWNTSVACLGDNASRGMLNLGLDLLIFAKFSDSMADSDYASGTSFYGDRDNKPLVGFITFNSKMDLTIENSETFLTRLALHELIHILGFQQIYFHNKFGWVNQIPKENTVITYLTAPKVIEIAKKYFDCSTITGVELNYHDSSIQHWNARYLLGDIMTKYHYTEEEVISEFTLAYLENTGFYKPKYYTGGLMRYGKGKGCEFLTETCVNKETKKINPKFGNEFFDSFRSVNYPRSSEVFDIYDPACSSGRQSKAYHYFDLLTEITNFDYLYFADARGGYRDAQYCPVSRVDAESLKKNYYVGRCNSLGRGSSFGKIRYYKGTSQINGYTMVNAGEYEDKLFDVVTGQTYSDHSFCYLSSLFNNGKLKNGDIVPEVLIRPTCYESFCSQKSLTIKIFNNYFVCPRAGGNIQVQGYNGTFSCPDYYLICSGTVMCNDMYDCAEKKSETKEESYHYDYTPLTTQNIESLTTNLDNTNNYELSDDGICPKYCTLCKEGRICVACKKDFYFLGSRKGTEVSCISKNEVENNRNNYAFYGNNRYIYYPKTDFEYYHYSVDGGVSYISCFEDCKKCNSNACLQCEDGYYIDVRYPDLCISPDLMALDPILAPINDTHVDYCYELIENCEFCSDKDTCIGCVYDYYAILSDKSTCVHDLSTIDLDKYYLLTPNDDDELHDFYFEIYADCTNPKYNDIPNCKKCSNRESCNQCQDSYTFINGDRTRCVQIESLKNEYTLDPSDITNYIPCEAIYGNCNTCDKTKCLLCKEGFVLSNDGLSKCSEDNGGIPVISIYEAEKLTSISLSYERINNFNFDKDNYKISFDLYTLTTIRKVEIGDKITVYVKLMHSNGISDSKPSESICVAQNIEEQSGSARAKFVCTIENLMSDDYYSLRYTYSDSICGVPKDEISLDPVLTNKYKNNNETKILPTFDCLMIDHLSCPSKGVLTLYGDITEKLNDVKKVNIPLTYPEGITLTCEFNDNQDELECKVDREIKEKTIIIEQTIIKQGDIDYFNLKSIKSEEKITCSNAILQDSLERTNAKITFRQVSHFNKNNDGFSFIFIGLAFETINKGNVISINVNINNESEDRKIDCTLENDVNPDNEQLQANFLCSVNKNTDDYWNSLNYDSISVSISPNNNIGGVSELDETSADPAKTDEEIKKIKEKIQNNEAMSVLENIIDYYESNVGINVLTLDSIDMDKCNTTGKLIIKGTFSNDFKEKINFDLPLTYPIAQFKCELNEVSGNSLTSITCKALATIISIENVVIENRLIKKKNKELFFIQGKSFTLNGKTSCEEYEKVRKEVLEQRMNSGILYSLMSNVEVVDQVLELFMAFTRESNDILFETIYNFLTSISVSTRRNLRSLETNTISDIKMICTLNQNLVLDSIGGYNCKSETNNIQGNILSLSFDTDDISNIEGIDNVNLQPVTESKNTIDYTNKENLQKINDLPNVNIMNINGESCSNNGQFIIYGKISDASKVEEKYSDIKLLLSSTESIGLCEVEISKDDKNVTMICQNSDKFDMSQIRIEKSIIKDSEGNGIFKINSYKSAEQFSCGISVKSAAEQIFTTELIIIPTTASKNKPEVEPINEPEIEPKQNDEPNPSVGPKPSEEKTDKPSIEPNPSLGPNSSEKKTDIPGIEPNPSIGPNPSEEQSNKPNVEPTNKPNEDIANKPAEEKTNSPIGEKNPDQTNNPLGDETNKPILKPTDKPIIEPSNKQNDSQTNKPISEPSNNPSGKTSDKPIMEPSNSPSVQPSSKPIEESINKPNDESSDNSSIEPSNKPNNDDEEDNEVNNGGTPLISKDEAEKLASISLSYEKISNFKYDKDNNKITFDLSTLLTTVGEVKIGDKIKINVNLIHNNGISDTESIESVCVAQKIEEQSGSARVKYECAIENLKSDDYYSLRYNSSDSICGVPKDEISLDPVLTNKYKNNDETKILPTFTYESIDHSSCPSKGVLTISGNITEKLNDVKKVNIPLTYPEGITLTCEFNDNQDKLECKVDREINNKTIIIEQTLIKQGDLDYFNLKSIKTEEKITCSNALFKDSLEKQNSTISVRQVSHFSKSSDGFSFVFVGLSSEKKNKGDTISINVNINNESEDRKIYCTLENDVNPENGQIQANYLCSVNKNTKNTDNYWNSINYDSISVSISQNNNIGGVTDLDETSANPAKTDEEIKKIKEKIENNEEISDLENVVDYYENKVEVNVLTLEIIDMDKCNTTGKLTIKGTFSNDFKEKINFDLPLTYPNAEFKCELNEVSGNTQTTITCKTLTTIISIENVVIESKMIKKKNKELFIIEGKSFTLNGKKSCKNFDTLRKDILEQRKTAKISYSIMSNLEVVNKVLQFFMAFTRESKEVSFEPLYNFYTSVSVSSRRNLRSLEAKTISDVPVTCKLNQSLVLDLVGGYNCKSDTNNIEGTVLSMKFNTDDVTNIAGIDNINLQSITDSKNTIDYTNIKNLKIINDLPNVNIMNINGESCSNNGQYIIYGKISDASKVEEKYLDIKLLLSSTESIGLCEVEINKNDKNVTMICQNSDKFDLSQIRIEKSIIKDSEGNGIFKINSYNSVEQFSCDISLNSLKNANPEKNETIPESDSEPETEQEPETSKTTKGNSFKLWFKGGSGLTGGAIAAIIISLVLVIIAVIIAFIFLRKGNTSKKKNILEDSTSRKIIDIKSN